MTLVIAKQWDDRIVVISETTISDRDAARRDVIPGRLKAIVLSEQLSIAYAGIANKAVDAIRELRKQIMAETNLPRVVEYLRGKTVDGGVDFLLISHCDGPTMFKIWRGQVSHGMNFYWLGDAGAASALDSLIALQSKTLGGLESSNEDVLVHAFEELIFDGAFPGVGGFWFILLGSPLGHCYQNHAAFYAWDRVRVTDIDRPEYRRFQRTGTAHYAYSTTSPKLRGAGIAGVFLPQVELGFIYSPLQFDGATIWTTTTLEELTKKIDQLAVHY